MAGNRGAGAETGGAQRGNRGAAEAEPEGEGAEAGEPLGALPGVVNDLPEVAPHEWIYLMS